MRIDLTRVKDMLGKYKYLLIVVLAGVVLLLWPSGNKGGAPASKSPSSPDFSLSDIESRVARALGKIEGVGKIEVVLTLKSGVETIYQSDEQNRIQQDRTGEETTRYQNDRSSDTVVASNGSAQEPVVVKQNYPEYQGALIVCEGGGDSAVAWQVITSVTALTGISSDRITVAKMKG